VFSYSNGLFGSHAWEMSLDKYNLFSLVWLPAADLRCKVLTDRLASHY
jgi:hypothetical protein